VRPLTVMPLKAFPVVNVVTTPVFAVVIIYRLQKPKARRPVEIVIFLILPDLESATSRLVDPETAMAPGLPNRAAVPVPLEFPLTAKLPA
jgi:hypothetical protein